MLASVGCGESIGVEGYHAEEAKLLELRPPVYVGSVADSGYLMASKFLQSCFLGCPTAKSHSIFVLKAAERPWIALPEMCIEALLFTASYWI